ncbi:MAG: DNA (cytosine-5-)-methyltransferase [Pseudomonadota bacterium]
MTLTFGCICSGISSPTQAWKPLGWRAAFYAECDKNPQTVLRHHYPDVPLRDDFVPIQPGDHDAIDVLVGGTPCQSFSVSGLRDGLDDARGNLTLEYVRLAERLGSKWLVWENVAGVLSSKEGRDFSAFIGGLASVGYGFAWRVLDTQYIRTRGFRRAIPQRRRRVILVGHLGDFRPAAAVLFDAEGMRGDPAPGRSPGEGVAPTIGARASSGGGFGTDAELDGALIPEVANCLTKRMYKGVNTTGDEGVTMIAVHGTQDPDIAENVCHPLGRNNGQENIIFDPTQITSAANRSKPQPGDPCHTLSAQGKPPHIASRWTVRKLTVVECERLQGFPDNFTAVPCGRTRTISRKMAQYLEGHGLEVWQSKRGWKTKIMADLPRYKMLGNTMSKNVMEFVGGRIDQFEQLGGI